MIWGYSWLRSQNIVGLAGQGSLQVMLLGWRIKVQPGVGGQCVLGDKLFISRFSWRGDSMDKVGDEYE